MLLDENGYGLHLQVSKLPHKSKALCAPLAPCFAGQHHELACPLGDHRFNAGAKGATWPPGAQSCLVGRSRRGNQINFWSDSTSSSAVQSTQWRYVKPTGGAPVGWS